MRIENADGGSSSTSINYPVGKMHTTANNMMSNAKKGLAQHEATWTKVQAYINNVPGILQGPIHAVLSAYEQHLRASYQWQMDYAQTLSNSATAMEDGDVHVANTFKGFN